MANRNVENLSQRELMELYDGWEDNSIYDGLDDDEAWDLNEELQEKYGLAYILRPDAPPEAVAAWKQHSKMIMEAAARGIIVD